MRYMIHDMLHEMRYMRYDIRYMR